jgi:hypothetical protein
MQVMSTKPDDFLLEEYKVISQNFSSAFQTMAALLGLFFVYTAAVFGFISHLFDAIKTVQASIVYGQLLAICFMSIVFTLWSQCWVSVYRSGAAMMLLRASALEVELSGTDHCTSFFNSYAVWYSSEKWLVGLYYATVIFFASVYAIYSVVFVCALARLVCPA